MLHKSKNTKLQLKITNKRTITKKKNSQNMQKRKNIASKNCNRNYSMILAVLR